VSRLASHLWYCHCFRELFLIRGKVLMILRFFHHFCAAGSVVQRRPDFQEDGFGVISPLMVPKSQFRNAHGCKEFFSRVSMTSLLRGSVFKAVQFDRQPGCGAIEVESIFSRGMLAAKFVAAKSPRSQPAPDQFFRPGSQAL